jgi:hypothetical protein
MSKYNGPYEPVNLNEGIALEVERDEFGHFTHTLWVDGEVYQITENAWEKLMRFNFDRFEEGRQSREEEIIKQIEEHNWDYLEIEGSEITALIKGEK